MDIREFDAQVQDSNRNFAVDSQDEINYSFRIVKFDKNDNEIENRFINVQKQQDEISVSSNGIPNYPEMIIRAETNEDEEVYYNVNDGDRVVTEIWELSKLILYPILFGKSTSEEVT